MWCDVVLCDVVIDCGHSCDHLHVVITQIFAFLVSARYSCLGKSCPGLRRYISISLLHSMIIFTNIINFTS